jgi:hypothetical protein
MSNRPKKRSGWIRTPSRTAEPFRPEVKRYAEALIATGMEEREVARAAFYAQVYGLDALTRPDNRCVVFAEPRCESGWDCLNPEHQRFES